ncbi:glycosyltransferase family 2 protein, partial [Pseudonocardia saturnea]
FDEAMGPGTPTHGGEDCEFLVRMILAGHVLGYVPGAYLWHHHRPDQQALAAQMEGYALGLGSFLTKVALSPQGRAVALRRLPAALARLRHISAREAGAGDAMPETGLAQRGSRFARGGWAYLRKSRAVRHAGGVVPPLLLAERSRTVPGHIRRAAARANAQQAERTAGATVTGMPQPRAASCPRTAQPA